MASSVKKNDAEQAIEAVVSDVLGKGKKRFAVARPRTQHPGMKEGDTITFSMTAWKGNHVPVHGQVVMLHDIEQFERGWRARKAEPVRLNQMTETARRKSNE